MARPTRPSTSNVRRERYGGVAGRRFQARGERAAAHRAAPDGVDADRPDDGPAIDEVVERLSRDMADAVNGVRAGRRAASAPSDRDARTARPTAPTGSPAPPPGPTTPRARSTFFLIALWLAVAGAVIAFVFPPAGVVCFVMAGFAAMLAAVLGDRGERPEPSAGDPPPPP